MVVAGGEESGLGGVEGADGAAAGGELGDGVGVVVGVGGGDQALVELVEVGGSAGAGELLGGAQAVGDGDGVGGGAAGVEVDAGVVDELVAGVVVVRPGDAGGDGVEGFAVAGEHGAEGLAFGVVVVGQGWWPGVVGWRGELEVAVAHAGTSPSCSVAGEGAENSVRSTACRRLAPASQWASFSSIRMARRPARLATTPVVQEPA